MNHELTRIINLVKDEIDDQEVVTLFEKVFLDTFSQTVDKVEDGTYYMVTGDIPAMWLRDSACQLRPIIPFLGESPKLSAIVKGIIARQLAYIRLDPYANSFTLEAEPERWDQDQPLQRPFVWEQKYEIDSLCFPFQLCYQYWKMTGDQSLFDQKFTETAEAVVQVWLTEQDHENLSDYLFVRPGEGYLSRKGKGSQTGYTGMTWSGFRPSDDPCYYHFLVPSNLFANHILGLMEEMLEKSEGTSRELKSKIKQLKADIKRGLATAGLITQGEDRFYAYEVDGLGNHLLMDDSNMPSLLSLPMLTGISNEDETYVATREIILSSQNPYYYEGDMAKGIGSPHTPDGYVWPIAIAVEGITAQSKEEKWEKIQMITQTTAGTGQVHESFNPNQPEAYTREWFSWANGMFCELVLDYCGYPVKVK